MKKPGEKVRGSSSGRPVMVLFDVLGQRWTMRILWELRNEELSFRKLRERCDNISPSILNGRLTGLKALQFVERGQSGYRLTDVGKELAQQLISLCEWADRWGQSFQFKER
ncbi:transcriptional regulator [Leisingera methylohalidivorans DSM 14336]|uniref:Transcriptional regulator n=1 Tax=Leisingera methylohalidivorans DSM 14336 TaxID=999552 RepID=V9VWF6_9RHOB|nr:transcriptional regulator [Leisingera methylohalidivorans DSM 14336]